jgi:hypothetical protein
MLHAAWYDAEKFVSVTPPTREPAPFDPKAGADPATLAALLLSWREDACPLALGDVPCRWLAADRGVLRGYALASPVSAFPVAVALGGGTGSIAPALKSLAALRGRGHHDAIGWLGLPPATERAAIVLAAPAWKPKPDAIEAALRRAAKRFKGTLRARVIAVTRCRDGLRRLVHVQTVYDGSPQ